MYAIHARSIDGVPHELTEPIYDTVDQAARAQEGFQSAYGPAWKVTVVALLRTDPDGTRFYRTVDTSLVAA